MSAANCDCAPCEPTTIVQVPGSAGAAGADGAAAFTTTIAEFTIPAKGDDVIVQVEDNSWVPEDSVVFIENAGWFSVTAVSGSTFLTLVYMNINANVNAGNGIFAGALVTPSGPPTDLTPPTALTNNTGGTVSNTLAVGVGIQTLSFHFSAAAFANGDLLTNYVPGYAFKILKFDARCVAPVTTAAKAATLNLEIVSTDVTGGVISLSGLYAMGAAQAGSAVTANNIGAATDSFSIEASAVTTFIEGEFELIIELANMDTVNALASLAAKTNEIITALT